MRKFLRRATRSLVLVLVVLAMTGLGITSYVDHALTRVPASTDYAGRTEPGGGTNWLLVGSDSREGLTREQEQDLVTGGTADAEGARTDTIMLLHIPAGSGAPTLVSLPRDSLVDIRGHGPDKLNAAYATGGPALLSRTVEERTGLRVDHYLEIGLGGFAGVVDAIDGVRVCLPQPIEDPKISLSLPAGCQNLTGAQALGFVRTRHFAGGDLQRAEHQRQFLTALVDKATSREVLLNPLRSVPMTWRLADTITVGDPDHLDDLGELGYQASLAGTGLATETVPVGGTDDLPGVGSVLRWDEPRAAALFDALRHDRPLP
ncbi:LCP family protein [Saccharopolyspora flava]|uniref:Transcriptional attenuator, LytR family n=1 Tax=Saccharopolyspora flava TaxID=95161 RepID=A0A1I6RPB2_9PSEU|nr:LCP family protein [Saccharopolyspora flava]SFS66515.1 transcriptional attenuator, LytR family [Saccharopolyspora flava]